MMNRLRMSFLPDYSKLWLPFWGVLLVLASILFISLSDESPETNEAVAVASISPTSTPTDIPATPTKRPTSPREILTETPVVPTVEPAEPIVELTTEPTTEFTPEPTSEPTIEPTSEPTTESTTEPTTEPTEEPTVELTINEPTDESKSELTPESTAEPTDELTNEPTAKSINFLSETPTLTPTSTPIPLLPAVIIDDQETQQEIRDDGKNHYRLLRWRSWSGDAPDGWYYVIRFLPAGDRNSVFYTEVIRAEAAKPGEGEHEGWLTYSFNIYNLPDESNSCYPYWDVIVGIDAGRVNCIPEERNWNGICRLTKFSEIQQYLATERPRTCSGDGDDNINVNGGPRSGSTYDPGHQGTHP